METNEQSGSLNDESSGSVLSRRPRPWFLRFSLRFLMLSITIACISFAIFLNRLERQKRMVATIEKLGGSVRYDYQYIPYAGASYNVSRMRVPQYWQSQLGIDFFHAVVDVKLSDTGEKPPLEEIARCLPRTTQLFVPGKYLDDESFKQIGKMKCLKSLYVYQARQVTDKGIAHLAGLKDMTNLHITSTKMTDKSFSVFGEMESLSVLFLYGNYITDEGIQQLSPLKALVRLNVCGKQADPDANRETVTNPITDSSLAIFSGLPSLTMLEVRDTIINDWAIEKFLKEHPRFTVFQRHEAWATRERQENDPCWPIYENIRIRRATERERKKLQEDKG